MLHITEADVQRLLPVHECVRLMGEAFRALREGTAINRPRHRLFLPTGAVLHQMAASYGRYFGTKVYSAHARHGANFTLLLYDAETAKPLAQFEANALGQIRTGAASGYATDVMAPRDASVLGIIGSGFQAWTQVGAMLAVRPIRSVRVFSRSAEKRERFAEQVRSTFGIEAEAVPSAEAASREADIVVTATYAKDPVLEAAWLKPGAHVNGMGSNQAGRRELPPELFTRARVIAVDSLEQAKIECGDFLLAAPAERWSEWPLGELAFADRIVPQAAGDVTVFKSLGLAVEDIAAAGWVYEQMMA